MKLTRQLLLALPLLLAAGPAWAHGGPVTPGEWWKSWDLDPTLLLALACGWAFYSRGVLAMWERAGVGRGVTRGQAGAFAGGMAVLLLALVSPLDGVSEQLSSAHMLQHMLLMLVAAPLFAAGTPIPVLLHALPHGWRGRAGSVVRRLEGWYAPGSAWGQPLLMWGLFAVTLWIWHLPALYGAALRSRLVHDCQHLAFLGSSYLFWRVLLDPVRRFRMSRGLGVLYLFGTCLHASALGIFMTFSPRVWYVDYGSSVPLWGTTALEDQQLAGLLMWMPGCLVYAAAAALLFSWWLREGQPEPSPTFVDAPQWSGEAA
jgi:putative membrane protein